MSDRFKGCLFGLLWALAALVLVCAIHLRDIARDIHAIRQSLAPPAIADADRHSIGEKEPK